MHCFFFNLWSSLNSWCTWQFINDWKGYELLCFIVVTAAKMKFISLKIITEKNRWNMNVEQWNICLPFPSSALYYTQYTVFIILLSKMCCDGWPAGGAGFTWATLNSPFKVTWSFNNLVNMFRLPCKISLSTLVGRLVGSNSNLTVMS